MKAIGLLSLLCFSLISCTAPAPLERKTNLAEEGLKGRVRQRIKTDTAIINGKAKMEGRWVEYYDTSGMLTESKTYNNEDRLFLRGVARYDGATNRIGYTLLNSDDSVFLKGIAKYDPSGRRSEYAMYRADGSLEYRHTYRYNDSNQMLEDCFFLTNGKIENKTLYDFQPDKILEVKYDKNNRLLYRKITLLDGSGLVKTEILENPDGNILHQTEYSYSNQLLIQKLKKSTQKSQNTLYHYNLAGQVILEVRLQKEGDGEWTLDARIEQEYDKTGNPIEIRRYIGETNRLNLSAVTVLEYVYDNP